MASVKMLIKGFPILLITIFCSCATANKNYDMFSSCYNAESNIENIDFYIPKENKKRIVNRIKQDYEGFRIVFLVNNKAENRYYIEIIETYIYYCLVMDSNYNILSENKGYLDI